MRPHEPDTLHRRARYETFEERLALSADPVGSPLPLVAPQLQHHYGEVTGVECLPDLLLEADGTSISHHADLLEENSTTAHGLTGVDYVHNMYGFEGAGQTVAIIDSGVAYDHVALGGGYGAGHRVVGGYDFAENDSDPYDDGPAGFHGTHVAGIVGSGDATHTGVAAGVDLVALRVFDDNGAGYFEWVESALEWVHEHRNDFANPITTVNLSLGVDWNAESVPNWAMLEDEFAQLQSDGIFIAVSAGNSFQAYGAAGLSYPAVSSLVVPVSSVDSNGMLSSFSQRHERVLAAPGRSITSTVPDHIYGADGNPNDFGSASGTSMAAPYVAGASTLVREAMEFVGYQNISQDSIYNHLRSTANMVYDTVTSASYHRLDVSAALQALMPQDDFGSTPESAYELGTVWGESTLSGLVGTLTDTDVFSLTAGQTGQLQFTFDTTHQLDLYVEADGGNGVLTGNTFSMDVMAGQQYTLTLGTKDGIGYYDASLAMEGSKAEADSDATGSDNAAGDAERESGSSAANAITRQAYQLDQARGLRFAGDDFLNWGGKNEKWLIGNDGWYFILADGEVYKWSHSGGANGELVATLDASYYEDLSQLYNARPPSNATNDGEATDEDEAAESDTSDTDADQRSDQGSETGGDQSLQDQARKLDEQYGFQFKGSYYENWAGLGEKWMASDEGWFFITEDGGLYQWNGSQSNASASERLATLDSTYHADPSRLHEAARVETNVFDGQATTTPASERSIESQQPGSIQVADASIYGHAFLPAATFAPTSIADQSLALASAHEERNAGISPRVDLARSAAVGSLYGEHYQAVLRCLTEMRDFANETDDLNALDALFDSIGEDPFGEHGEIPLADDI